MPLPERSKTMARILIAEDDDIVRALLVRALGGDGHDLIETADGTTAFDALNASKGGIDLLLSDVKMPGMDGIELALATGRYHPDTAIMLMTGHVDQRERAHDLDALVHEVISKPFSVNQITSAVREALVRRP